MDEILNCYKHGKYNKCVELIKLIPPTDNVAENFTTENCALVCSSIIKILENNPESLTKAEESLYLFFENVTSVGLLPASVPLHLKLIVIFNFYWWLLFHSNKELNEDECEEYLTVVNVGLCRGYIQKINLSNIEPHLKMRLLVLNGQLCSSNSKHKEAFNHFQEALQLSINSPVPFFYIGQESGKMGLYDLMVEYFEKLLKAVEGQKERDWNSFNFVSLVLNWIHPHDEITEDEALYALAVSYGLNERFSDAASTFDRYFQYVGVSDFTTNVGRIIKIPNILTVFHDASLTNMLAGNLLRAENMALKANNQYTPHDFLENSKEEATLLEKDVDWLRKTIEEELLESDIIINVKKNDRMYNEHSIYFLSENVIAQLILAEIQKIQQSEEYTMTLKKIFSCFSCYFGGLTRKEFLTDEEKQIAQLIKALGSKTCLRIAQLQIQSGSISNVEKMLKRSLSCNKGDKDVLYCYAKFLIGEGRHREALKLWNSFSKEETTVTSNSVQSLSLRYFLTDQVSAVELEKMHKELQRYYE
ncbi:hypothetical protein RUM43_010980 [Polyplax serrata]|uniref:Uncharacterized protein n=1 Tax=Polyplax serrata TaxID=468196 RepID=A0AAN8RZL8_POLSC